MEWMVLKQLDRQAAEALEERMRTVVTEPENMFPIRISSYAAGTLMVYALVNMGVYSYAPAERPVMDAVLKDIRPSDECFPGRECCDQKAANAVGAFYRETEAIIEAALKRNEVVVNGPVALVGVNIYDARCYKGYMTSRYFLQYLEKGAKKTIEGNFVLKMADEKTVARVYRWVEA